MMEHAPERGDAGSRTDQEEILIQRVRKGEYALGTAEKQFSPYRVMFENIGGAQASRSEYDHQFENIGPVGPAGDGITAPSLPWLFVNGEVQGHELAWLKIEAAELWHLDPVTARVVGFIHDPGDFACSPGLSSHAVILWKYTTGKFNLTKNYTGMTLTIAYFSTKRTVGIVVGHFFADLVIISLPVVAATGIYFIHFIKSRNMRNRILILALVFAALAVISFSGARTAIVGRVSPGDGVDLVWLLGENDSLKTAVSEGQFYFEVKPGSYKLLVDARAPYKDVTMDNLVVKSEETLDVGEIILKQ